MAGFWGPLAFEQVTVSGTPVGISTRPGGTGMKASAAEITLEGGSIRYRVDGGTPTAMSGVPAAAGAVIALESWGDVQNFRAVSSGGAPVLNVTPYIQYG